MNAANTENAPLSAAREPGPINAARPALLTIRQCAELLGVSLRTVQLMRKQDWFPLPIALGERSVRWHRDELLDALAQRAPRRTEFSEPAGLLRAKLERLKRGAAATVA